MKKNILLAVLGLGFGMAFAQSPLMDAVKKKNELVGDGKIAGLGADKRENAPSVDGRELFGNAMMYAVEDVVRAIDSKSKMEVRVEGRDTIPYSYTLLPALDGVEGTCWNIAYEVSPGGIYGDGVIVILEALTDKEKGCFLVEAPKYTTVRRKLMGQGLLTSTGVTKQGDKKTALGVASANAKIKLATESFNYIKKYCSTKLSKAGFISKSDKSGEMFLETNFWIISESLPRFSVLKGADVKENDGYFEASLTFGLDPQKFRKYIHELVENEEDARLKYLEKVLDSCLP